MLASARTGHQKADDTRSSHLTGPRTGGVISAMSPGKGPLDRYPVYDPMVACRTLDGEAVIVHSRTRRLHVLDEVGTFIWEAFEPGDQTVRSVIGAVCAEFDVDTETAERDVQDFLATLTDESLVQLVDAPSD